jgi:hypothetical protein
MNHNECYELVDKIFGGYCSLLRRNFKKRCDKFNISKDKLTELHKKKYIKKAPNTGHIELGITFTSN